MRKMYDVILAHSKRKGKNLLKKLSGKKPFFICIIGTTETAKIPGISAAGRQSELTEYTPSADIELIFLGKCECIDGVPVTPDGIPTPALITTSALKLENIPALAIDGGLVIQPRVPILELGAKPARDIRTGNAINNVEEVLERARLAGEIFSKTADYLIIGESIPGGTTTALSVLLAMGVNAEGKISSSMFENPHELKIRTAKAGLKAADIKFGDLIEDPLKAISCVGDSVIPAFAGLILGSANKIPVLMAGGTQMCAVLAIINALEPKIINNLAIATTRWIIMDKTADLKGIVTQIADIPILAADLDFSQSRFSGLKAYESGAVKEGVGAGGAAISAMLKSKGAVTKGILLREIEKNYEKILGLN
jgi:uncharacterized protein (TIGR00303 family)